MKFTGMEFRFPCPKVLNVKKGVDFYFIENHELPVITASIIFKSGSYYDPSGQEGLSSMTWNLLKNSGTVNQTHKEIENQLDYYGSAIELSTSREFTAISLWALKKNFAKTWKILLDMLFNPTFNKKKFDYEKQDQLESVRRRWEEPGTIGHLIFLDLIYGKGHPEIRRPATHSISSINAKDVRHFYESNIRSSEIIIALSGDINPAKIYSGIKRSFSTWNASVRERPKLPPVKLASPPGIYLVNRENMTRAILCIGHPGINRLDKDNAEITLLNHIYGNFDLNSRLVRELRTKRGLVYQVYGKVGKGRDLGFFLNYCITGNQSVGKAITRIKQVMLDITTETVSDVELNTAKKYKEKSLVSLFDDPKEILYRKIFYKLKGYPNDYLDTYVRRIRKVGKEKVRAMAKRT
ncbi:MAG: insulinase family protein, partial [bacterium]|nr:insulinase family protein [bacterium]